jgi:hypothetical protein
VGLWMYGARGNDTPASPYVLERPAAQASPARDPSYALSSLSTGMQGTYAAAVAKR